MPGTYTIPTSRPGLGRHVNHDPRSRRYPYLRGAALSLPDVRHQRHIPIFDQGQTGSCTGNAALGILATGPYWDALRAVTATDAPTGAGPFQFSETGALALYSAITAADPYPGEYPPDDTGSDGLSAAKTLQRLGIIPGYQHTFFVADALAALATYPLLVGTNWSESMFTTDGAGLTSYDPRHIVGGHEWIVDQCWPAHGVVGGTSSWGTAYGLDGRFYLTVADFRRLLDDDGDVIVLTPPTRPAPLPVPDVVDTNPDLELVAAFERWRYAKGL